MEIASRAMLSPYLPNQSYFPEKNILDICYTGKCDLVTPQ